MIPLTKRWKAGGWCYGGGEGRGQCSHYRKSAPIGRVGGNMNADKRVNG